MPETKRKWRTDAINVIKKAMADETNEYELKDMANALNGLVPYKPEGERPMPVRVVNNPKKKYGVKGPKKKKK